MGLISKIEDKVKGNSSDQNKLEKEPYESSSSGSRLQHPISSSDGGPTGSAVGKDGYGPQTGSTSDKYGTSDTYGSKSDTYGGQSGSYGNQPDTYTSKQGYTGSATSNRMPGEFEPRGEMRSTTSGHTPNQPYDPYSPKGQMTAADGQPTSQTQNFSRTSPQSGSHNTSTIPSSNQPLSSSNRGDDRYESQSTSQHHYGRDAAMAGGVGAGGVGAYEIEKHQQNQSSVPQGTSTSHRHGDDSYTERSSGGQQYGQQYGPGRSAEERSMESGVGSGGMSGESAGLSHAKKMVSPTDTTHNQAVVGQQPHLKTLADIHHQGGAYERGYQDAMDHMKAEMQKRT